MLSAGAGFPAYQCPPLAPTVGARPGRLAFRAQLEDEGTGVGDYLDRASLGLGFHLWDCRQGKRAG